MVSASLVFYTLKFSWDLNETTHVTPYKLSGPRQPHIFTYKCIHVIGSCCMFAVYHGTVLATGCKTNGRQIPYLACMHGGICVRMIRRVWVLQRVRPKVTIQVGQENEKILSEETVQVTSLALLGAAWYRSQTKQNKTKWKTNYTRVVLRDVIIAERSSWLVSQGWSVWIKAQKQEERDAEANWNQFCAEEYDDVGVLREEREEVKLEQQVLRAWDDFTEEMQLL